MQNKMMHDILKNSQEIYDIHNKEETTDDFLEHIQQDIQINKILNKTDERSIARENYLNKLADTYLDELIWRLIKEIMQLDNENEESYTEETLDKMKKIATMKIDT